ncbi:hypothetical protein [Occultella gossypii]|uniref:Uncharacterized protein n=1 Tax=Occultella gossypii TaxID=2800820 RepID=A0ABS7SGE7_9MICO|nr:hypothetical protein [Occultella gossypii]MBZ2199220.1 hypothetical protein [Occultella gossypii]
MTLDSITLDRRLFLGGGFAAAGLVLTPWQAQASPVRQPARADPDDPEVTRFTSQNPGIRYLGQPVNSQIGARAPRIALEDGRWVEYQVYKGSANTDLPATFAVTDIETGDVVRSIKMPTAEAAFDITVATDGKVYLPSYYDYRLWQYDPATKQLNDLGPLDVDTQRDHAFGAGFGPDGMAFFGTYSGSRLHRFEPDTGTIRNLGTVDPDEDYIHFICWDPASNAIFCTTGGKRAAVWRIEDLGMGAKTKIIDGSTIPLLDTVSFLGMLDCVEGHLISRTGGSLIVTDLYGNLEYYTGGREIAAYHAVPASDGSGFFFSEYGALQKYDFGTHTFSPTAGTVRSYISSGTELPGNIIVGSDMGGPFTLNYVTGERTEHEPSFRQPTLIQKIFPGPGERMFASGYMVGLAEINTEGGEPNDTLNQGQFESWIVRDGLMYLGAYGFSKFSRYDPDVPGTAPKQLFTSAGEDLDRPFGMAYNPERDEVYMGSVPVYGQYQGGLAIYEFGTGRVTHLKEEIVENQSIVSVVYNPHDKLVYLGTTIDGGMGNTPTSITTEGQVIVFDPATRTVVRSFVPVHSRQGVTGLLVDPDGSVWGVAEEQLMKIATDGTVRTFGAVSRRYPGAPDYVWAWAYLNWSALDGMIYGTARGHLFRVDPSTGVVTTVADDGASWGATDQGGDVYFSYRTHLFKYLVPQPISGQPTTVQKLLAVEAYAQGRDVVFPADYPAEWRAIFARIEERVAAGRADELREEYGGEL